MTKTITLGRRVVERIRLTPAKRDDGQFHQVEADYCALAEGLAVAAQLVKLPDDVELSAPVLSLDQATDVFAGIAPECTTAGILEPLLVDVIQAFDSNDPEGTFRAIWVLFDTLEDRERYRPTVGSPAIDLHGAVEDYGLQVGLGCKSFLYDSNRPPIKPKRVIASDELQQVVRHRDTRSAASTWEGVPSHVAAHRSPAPRRRRRTALAQ